MSEAAFNASFYAEHGHHRCDDGPAYEPPYECDRCMTGMSDSTESGCCTRCDIEWAAAHQLEYCPPHHRCLIRDREPIIIKRFESHRYFPVEEVKPTPQPIGIVEVLAHFMSHFGPKPKRASGEFTDLLTDPDFDRRAEQSAKQQQQRRREEEHAD